MSKDNEAGTPEPLSDAERLQALEKSSTLSRLILYGVAGVVVLMLVVLLAVQVSGLLADDPNKAAAEQISQLEKQVHGLKGEISELQGQVQKQGAQLALQQSGNLTGILKPAATEDPGTVGQLAKTLQGQENDFQQVILTLQVGMRDLAYMLPGSRTWLDYYTETLNKSLATSKARTLELQQWAKGQAPAVAPVLKQP
ncbi:MULTISPECIES: hypothetical protein [Pseudomonas]|jgi:hypothetical protein|uniref:hypothetical protein n=1 Tax=Pseudomonas TaxID=286 RepID=UPI00070A961D|nr:MULTISPECIES: hypothetical protein [Pseudomonas]MCS8157214.1 hypothetical protein [Pseudomonas aeruginosa]MDG4418266.1 hypothetical protein [Pseudomonas aeruginosa]ORE40497.1 hypothetical protein BKN49_21845 [Pseudomonas aeruginosa]PMX05063.1 hypothetical protein C1Y25_29320 [Pseudomonas sp. MPBC4-3]PMX41745.1 hypothetical protein C1Y20_29570 [Pseudomonas sp. FW301-21B01]